jgi:putative hemolysin
MDRTIARRMHVPALGILFYSPHGMVHAPGSMAPTQGVSVSILALGDVVSSACRLAVGVNRQYRHCAQRGGILFARGRAECCSVHIDHLQSRNSMVLLHTADAFWIAQRARRIGPGSSRSGSSKKITTYREPFGIRNTYDIEHVFLRKYADSQRRR